MEKTITLTLIFVSTLPNDSANKIHRTYTTGQKIGANKIFFFVEEEIYTFIQQGLNFVIRN